MHAPIGTSVRYRSEIDGLRALAVIPVVLFHAGVPGFRGGYVGVDVFFVISGYLITSLLLADLENGKFSLADFYERRARRILPALFLVMFCCIPLAWTWMLSQQFKEFGQGLVAATLFVSNILAWHEADYFATPNAERPLLHIWSLAVEEQFYLLFPLFLMVLYRRGLGTARLVVPVVGAASFLLCIWGAQAFPEANFYFASSRAWELLAGAACADPHCKNLRGQSRLLPLIGIGLIIVAIVGLKESSAYPSHFTLLPVIGTVLVILFATDSDPTGRSLSLKPVVFIGILSYSAYLWHQPLMAFLRLQTIGKVVMPAILAAAIGSFLLAYLSWRFVETPFRKPGRILANARILWVIFALCAVVLVGIGGVIHLRQGFPERFPPQVNRILAARDDRGPFWKDCRSGQLKGVQPRQPCALGDPARKKLDFVLVGDSFGVMIAPAVDLAARQARRRGAMLTGASCPALLDTGGGLRDYARACERLQDRMVAQVRETGARTVLLASAWRRINPELACALSRIECLPLSSPQAAIEGRISRTVHAFEQAGIRVVFVGVPPSLPYELPGALAKQVARGGGGDVWIDASAYDKSLLDTAIRQGRAGRAGYIDLEPAFCVQDRCRLAADGVPMLFDAGHLTATRSRQLSPLFAGVMADMRP